MKHNLISSAIVLCIGCTSNPNKPAPQIKPEAGVVVDIGTQPCTGISSGFDGDSQCLEAPPADKGFQLHYGPSNYDDPVEVNKFLINPSEELVDCMFVKTPNQKDVYVNQYHARLRPGTHHMITYVQQAPHDDSTVPEACNQGPGFTFLVGATTVTTDISATGEDKSPEYTGAALKVGAVSQAAIQLHYINTTSHQLLKEGWINVIYIDEADVKLQVSPITFIGGLGMAVKPNSKETIHGGGASCTAQSDLSIITLVGHAHSHTKRVGAYIQRSGSQTKDLIYETYNWEEPGFLNYNSVKINPSPDAATNTTGGVSGILTAHAGDQLLWECDVDNNSNYTLNFADKALTGEMCNMFGVYAPSTGSPWSCFSL